MIVASHEAKTNLPDLIRRAETGERIFISRNGAPVVALSPVKRPRMTFDEVTARMAELRKGCRLDGLTIQELRDEGRR